MSSHKFDNIIITREEIDKFGEKRLRINHGILRKILLQPAIGNKPVAFISITGCKRTGKSFILNYIIRYLRQKGWDNPKWMGDADMKANREVDIEWKQGKDRHTTGIRIFEEKFEVPISENKTMIVMIMDTQGLFDFETPEQMNKAILTLSTLLSSVQIFNVQKHIDAQHMQYLETCVDFAQETKKQEFGNRYLKLERLMFLVRDCPEDNENDDIASGFDSTYTLKYGNDLLNEILQSRGGGNHQIQVRRKIKNTFENVSCFPLPYPGKQVDKRYFHGANKDLDEDFLTAVKSFVEEIAHPQRLKPKRSRKRNLTAREIINTITGCDTLFADKMFEAGKMIIKNVEGYYASECQEAVAEYMTMLEQRLLEAGVDKKKRDIVEQETRSHALRRFETAVDMGSHDIRKKYKTDLQLSISEHYNNVVEQFKCREKLRVTMVKEHTRAAVQEYCKLLEDEICKATENSTLYQIHEYVTKKMMMSLGDDIDKAYFKSQVSNTFLSSSEKFARQLEESIRSKSNENEKKLFLLVQLELRDECEDMWNKTLQTYFPESAFEQHKDEIDENITGKFWTDAVNATEYKYMGLFYKKLAMAKSIVEHEAGWNADSTHPAQDEPPDEGEENYLERVNELVDEYSRGLREGIKHITEDCDEYQTYESELQKATERKFYEFCNNDWNPALDKLEHMLEIESTKAQDMHEMLWADFRETVQLVVDSIVLEHEKKFHGNMSDTHIESGNFSSYYSEAIAYAKKFRADRLDPVEVSESAKAYYESILEEKMNKSRISLEERNKRNKEMRPIRDCYSPPPKEKSFHKIFGWLRGKKKTSRK